MTEQRRRPDPASRPDPYELAVARAAQEPGPEEGDGAPPLPRLHVGPFRVGPLALVVGFLVLVLASGLVRLSGQRPVELAPSCSAPALALSAERVRPGGLVRFTAVGPDGPLELTVVGTGGEQALPAVALDGCRATGQFGVQVPPGEYAVTVRRDGEAVASQDLVVTEPGDPDAG